MSNTSSALVVVLAVVTAMLAPTLVVRAQGTARFEYARLTPYIVRMSVPTTMAVRPGTGTVNMLEERIGYRACVAGVSDWACQEFKPTETNSNDALRSALVHLGNQGWELVSAAPEDGNVNGAALTYVFKRQSR